MTWAVESAVNEETWTQEYVQAVIASPFPQPPPHEQKIGGTEVSWRLLEPDVAFIHTAGGEPNDRFLAEVVVREQLQGCGIKQAQFTFYRRSKVASWDDIMAKSQRLIQSGNVTLLRNGGQQIVGHVMGDHGEYQTEISREDPTSEAISQWQCDCPWDQYAWQRCVIMGTMISMADGTPRAVEDIRIGDAIIDHAGSIGIVAETHVEDWDDDAVTFHTTGFEPLTVKPNHPVWGVERDDVQCKNKDGSLLKKGGKRGPWYGYCPVDHESCRNPRTELVAPKFKLAEDFDQGDFLVRPTPTSVIEQKALDLTDLVSDQVEVVDDQIIPLRGMTTRWGQMVVAKQRKAAIPAQIPINEDLMRFLGYYLAEGCATNYSVKFSFHRQEAEYLDDVAQLAESIFGNKACYEGKTENCLNVVMNNREIACVFKSLLGTGYANKRIPDWIMHLPPQLQMALILGWHRGDGHIRKSDGRYELTTVSPVLAHQAEFLLQRQGYTVGVIHERRSEREDTNEQDAYKLYWHVESKANRGIRFTEDGNTMVKIERVERNPYYGKMIDLTVIGNPGYLANGFSVHNTRQWKKYEGRPCAHVLATYWTALAAPLDEEFEPGGPSGAPGAPGGPSGGPNTLFDPGTAQPAPKQQAPTAPPMAPVGPPPLSIPGVIPPSQPPPGPEIIPQFPGLAPQSPVSVPGQYPQSPLNPLQNPGGTFSKVASYPPDRSVIVMKNGTVHVGENPDVHHYMIVEKFGIKDADVAQWGWTDLDGKITWESGNLDAYAFNFSSWRFAAEEFQNSDMVRLNIEEYGVMQGKSEEHGAGQYRLIPKNSIGEVMGQDSTTGWVNVNFPIHDSGPMEPFSIAAWIEPANLSAMPNTKKPGPFIKRR